MTVDGEGVELPLEAPEADVLEQQTPVQPDAVDDASDLGPDAGDVSVEPEADEADRWEQQQPVPLGEDE